MITLTRDPMLTAARIFILFAMGVTALGGGILLLAAPIMVIGRYVLLVHASAFLAFAGLVLIAAAMAALFFLLLRHLLHIVETVGQGDPFVPANATRLTSMAWLSLLIEAARLPAGAIIFWLSEVSNEKIEINFDISFGGVLLSAILFVLSRVFRKGAEMRADLEGMI
ncbi:hypothetical protein WSK_3390 [Novosphingobium sp. Rr 2-17]|uniref:DUF2975 domain-containing protein n=1 Tax=Novosphingobium sp. Rr 2-17 TaxID=555793 RepID=UPI00026998B0|nr:DUF2975 domain-containing protein [Novosphingobium sp. Rr 2-17]EIZ78080.1 hypothetical protein WSK_3390 [Novosphingobium sp. Rr 2-17]